MKKIKEVDTITIEEAKMYSDLHILSRVHDINLTTAVCIANIDPSNFLSLRTENYLKLVFKSLLFRLTPIEIIQILNQSIEEIAEETYTPSKNNKAGVLKQAIDSKVKILTLANKYKLEIKKNKCVCPFHADSDASLVFYPKSNSWFCFGCRQGGDVIKFYQMIRGINK